MEVGMAAGGSAQIRYFALDHHDPESVLERALDSLGQLRDGEDTACVSRARKRKYAPSLAHRARSCASTASARLLSKKATVIGPTPPGTGVTADAMARTESKSTSPSNLGPPASGRSMEWMPTSITTAPGFTWREVTARLRPMATIRISASLATDSKSRVAEWQRVTVAFIPRAFSERNTESGRPTMRLLPRMTTRFPVRSP